MVQKLSAIRPLHKEILVYDMFFGEQQTSGGIIILDDDKTDRGIHPRWAKVYAVGPEHNSDLQPEMWVLIEHGRWSRGFTFFNTTIGKEITIRKVDEKAILLMCDEDPEASKDGVVGPIMHK